MSNLEMTFIGPTKKLTKNISLKIFNLANIISGNRLKRLYDSIKNSSFERKFAYGFVLQTGSPQTGELVRLFEKYGSDKGSSKNLNPNYAWPPHNYGDFYQLLFETSRHNIKSVLECGLGTNNTDVEGHMGAMAKPGASLYAWRDYFPNAMVVGIDIDDRVLFSDERIFCFQCDQTSKSSINNLLDQLPFNEIDLIVDDGLHNFLAASTLFAGMISKLSSIGTYVIEDANVQELHNYRKFFSETYPDYSVTYVNGKRPFGNLTDNRLIIIRKKI